MSKMKKIIDLTLTLSPGMRGVSCEVAKTVEKDGWNAKTWHLYSHAGTHMDAPIHYEASGVTVDKIPLDNFIGDAWIADLTGIKPKAMIKLIHIEPILEEFNFGDSLLLKTGWSQYHGISMYREELPRVSEEVARWCVDNRLKMLGVEPPAVADVFNIPEVTRIHKILLEGNVIIVEGLCNLDAIPGNKCKFYAMPLKLEKGDGAPVRAFAEIDQ